MMEETIPEEQKSSEEIKEPPVAAITIEENIKTLESPIDEIIAENVEENVEKPAEAVVTPPLKRKRKKCRKIKRSKEYPKFYKNAYVRYCDKIRAKICEENPTLTSVEITKLVASKWCSLQKEEKQPYLDEAKVDKDRFEKELKVYKDLNPEESDKPPSKKAKKMNNKESIEPEKKQEISIAPAIPSTSTAPMNSNIIQHPSSNHLTVGENRDNNDLLKVLMGQNCEIPIFTDTFLEHNKVIETEVKLLRKNNIEIEQQNSVLMKHIENMENGVIKIESEIAQNRKKNMQLEVYLTKLKVILSANFNSLQIPGYKGATIENIDKYITDLAKSSSTSNLNKARDIIKKIDLQI